MALRWIQLLIPVPKILLLLLWSSALVQQATLEILVRTVHLATSDGGLGPTWESVFKVCFLATAMATQIPVTNRLAAV